MTHNTEKSLLDKAIDDYYAMITSLEYGDDRPDYSLLDGHLTHPTELAPVSNSGISVFDMYRKEHVFASYNFVDLLGYDVERLRTDNGMYFDSRMHPHDRLMIMRYGMLMIRYFKENPDRLHDSKIIYEYRVLSTADDQQKYVRVIEQQQVLETTPGGRLWLALSVLDISPDQAPMKSVPYKLLNYKTGKVQPVTLREGDKNSMLSVREREILQMVREGYLSKEISDRLSISVHAVNTHRQRILEKLNVDNPMEAVKYASRLGLLD